MGIVINLIDPTGMSAMESDDPIYDDQGRLIGDDGKTNGLIHIVFDEKTQSEISVQTENGNQAIDLLNYNH